MSSKPDWAKGAKWNQWQTQFSCGYLTRSAPSGNVFKIHEHGRLDIWSGDRVSTLFLHDTDSSLRVANYIAEELGGWEW